MTLQPSRPLTLLFLAAVSIAALAALSDLGPQEAAGLGQVDSEATVAVVITGCRTCTGGYLLEIADGDGGEATAFCPSALLPAPPAAGAAATLTVRPSADGPHFLYVSAISFAAP